MASINIRGAREHNLKNVDVEIPRDTLTVITGLSGSGKSSLAFDTIYAEGQRRYVESLSAYARQFLELMQKPDVDSIDGLSPAISIEQKTTSRNPRSTVGTVTEIYDYMRLMFARIGIPYSPATGLPIEAQTVSQMVDRVMEMTEGTRLYLLAPIVRGRKGEYRRELQELAKKGFQRVKVDGEHYEIDEAPVLEKNFKHDIEVVVDRLVVREGLEQRLADSFETALELADGLAFTEEADFGDRMTFSAKFACPVSGFTIDEIEPRLFSFNNPFGACPTCDGLGTQMYFDPELVVPEDSLSLEDGAIAPWATSNSHYYDQTLESLGEQYGFGMGTRWNKLKKKFRDVILYGSGKTAVTMHYDDGKQSYDIAKPFEGVIPNMERRWQETDSSWIREELSKYQTVTKCDACDGNPASIYQTTGEQPTCNRTVGPIQRRTCALRQSACRFADFISAWGKKTAAHQTTERKIILAAPSTTLLNLFHDAPTLSNKLGDVRRGQTCVYRPNFLGIDVDHGSCKPVRRDAPGDFYDKTYAYRCRPPGRNPCGGFEQQSDRRI